MEQTFNGQPVQITGRWEYPGQSNHELGLATTSLTDSEDVIAVGGEKHQPTFATRSQIKSLAAGVNSGLFGALLAD